MAAAAATVPSSSVEEETEEFIDLDLTPLGDLELRTCDKSSGMPCAEELFGQGRRLQLLPYGFPVQQQGAAGGRRSAATVSPAPPRSGVLLDNSRCKKAAKAARYSKLHAFVVSLFARSPFISDEQSRGAVKFKKRSNCGRADTALKCAVKKARLLDEEEERCNSRRRKSFSGVIKRRLTTSASVVPAPRRSSSASSSEAAEGLIEGAITYCKKSQQQLPLHATKYRHSDAGDGFRSYLPRTWNARAGAYV